VAPPGIDVISISGTSPLDLVDPTSYEAVESLDYAPVRTIVPGVTCWSEGAAAADVWPAPASP
jgi:hypothetical protein